MGKTFLKTFFSEWRVPWHHPGATAMVGCHHSNNQRSRTCRSDGVKICAGGQTQQVPGPAQGPAQMWTKGCLPTGSSWSARASGKFCKILLWKKFKKYFRLTHQLASKWRRSWQCCPAHCNVWSKCVACIWGTCLEFWTFHLHRRLYSITPWLRVNTVFVVKLDFLHWLKW